MTQHDDVFLEFSRPGRSRTSLAVVGLIWALCVIGGLIFEVSLIVIAVLVMFTLPALRDFWKGHSAGLVINSHQISWHTGEHTAEIGLGQIDHVRVVTRLDLSVRAAIVLYSGRKLRVPAESTPTAEILEQALSAADITIKRHHFTPL